MRVLIAVNHQRRLQEHQQGDAVDGEVVAPVLLECVDSNCRCDRSWAGLATAGLSTLAEVADRPNLTRVEVRRAIHGLLEQIGWIDDLVQAIEADQIVFDGHAADGSASDDPVWLTERMIDDHLAQIDAICSAFPVGTVLSRLGDLVAPTVESRAA